MFFRPFAFSSREDLALLSDKFAADKQSRRTVASTLNLMNYIVGAGLLGLPWAFREAGMVNALLSMIFVGVATTYSFFLLLWSSDLAGHYSFDSLANFCFGKHAAVPIKLIMILDSLGTLTAYILVISQAMDMIAQYAFGGQGIWGSPNFVLAFSILIFVLPLCLLPDISWLGFTSLLALLPMIYLQVYQGVLLGQKDDIVGTQGEVKAFGNGFFLALPIFVFAFASQQALFPVYNSVRDVTDSEQVRTSTMRKVVVSAIGGIGFIYTIAGILGYLTFPETANGNILLSFPKGPATDTLFMMMGVSLILTYPVVLWPCRFSLDRLIYHSHNMSVTEHPWGRFAVETIVILGFIFLTAVLIPSFNTLLGLIGAVTSTIIGFVLPSLFYLRASPMPFREDKKKWGAVALLVIGSSAGIVSAVQTILEFAGSSNTQL